MDSSTPDTLDAASVPTGEVKGTINYAGEKRGTVVIAFLEFIPGTPGAPTDRGPKTGGFALSNPANFPGTFSTRVAPGNWVSFAYLSVGQPPHLDGPRPPADALGMPTPLEVKVDQTTEIVINLGDLPPPSDGDGGTDAGDDGGDGGDTDNGG